MGQKKGYKLTAEHKRKIGEGNTSPSLKTRQKISKNHADVSDKNNFNYKHGNSSTRLYHIWKMMKQRCNNLNATQYNRYGGRGISVCEKWQNSFEVFRNWAIANSYQDDMTIDKIDNDGNYEPANCQWITKSENSKKRAK